MLTLGIDYGAKYIGIALVRKTPEGNKPLLACTIAFDSYQLKKKVQPRAALRRLRRTRKTKQARLKALETKLTELGIDESVASSITRFSNRRGYKPLNLRAEQGPVSDGEDLTYWVCREEFFSSLESELTQLIADPVIRRQALEVCDQTLNRHGEPHLEVRPLRIDNRGVSRCAWEGCRNVTPRRENAMEDAIKQSLATFFQGAIREDKELLGDVRKAASELNRVASHLRKASAEKANALRKKARNVLRTLRQDLLHPKPSDTEAKKAWQFFEKGLIKLIEKSSGRNTYCRKHAEEYVLTVVAGKQAPFKKTISESDILSRREQIVFNKLWRYIEARILPLASSGIDALVMERTAFDLLRGKQKRIATASQDTIEEIYQLGPMLGFGSMSDMLREEFAGLCAYCGQQSDNLIEREHIMPRRDFFFDSYLNLLPSCPACNKQKSFRRIGPAALTISEQAYMAYCGYLGNLAKKRPLHALHTEKKGILNLMRNPNRSWEVERYLSLIANNLASVTQTQRGPRPLARYLYSKLSARQKKKPKIAFRNGRHTALYRTIAYPQFDKPQDKTEPSPVNHALDALLLASYLPAPTVLEAQGFNISHVKTWTRKVRDMAPVKGPNGIPEIPRYDWYVPGFEEVDTSGYVSVDLHAMNWNQQDAATHKQDPYGWSEKAKQPTKRIGAQVLYDKLSKAKTRGKVESKVKRIHHPALRQAMEKHLKEESPGPAVAEAMKEWLRESVAKSIGKSTFSNHPADVTRKADLEKFARNPEAPIPVVIGVKSLDTGVQGKIDLERKDPFSRHTTHRYMTSPANRAAVLAYPMTRSGTYDSAKPCLALVRQHFALKTAGSRFGPKPRLLERGMVWNEKKVPIEHWQRVLEQYLLDCGLHSYIVLTPCCVIRYEDGTERFIRNFVIAKTNKKLFKHVVGLRRTPFASSFISLTQLTVVCGDATD